MHAYVSLNHSGFPKFCLEIIQAEMLDRASKMAIDLHLVRHLVHHRSEDTYIGKQDIGRTNRGIKCHFVDKVFESRKVIVQHVEVHVEQAVVGLHIHPVKVDAFRTDHDLRIEMFQFQSTQFIGGKGCDIGMDGVTQHKEIRGLEVNVVEVEMGIIHQMLLGLLRIVLVLVPEQKIHLL